MTPRTLFEASENDPSTRKYTGEARVHHRIRMRAGDGFGVRAWGRATAAWAERTARLRDGRYAERLSLDAGLIIKRGLLARRISCFIQPSRASADYSPKESPQSWQTWPRLKDPMKPLWNDFLKCSAICREEAPIRFHHARFDKGPEVQG